MAWSTVKGGGSRRGSSKRKGTRVDNMPPSPIAPSDRKDICIRAITNGYLVHESGYRGGKYYTRETYTAKAPRIAITPGKGEK